MAGPEPGAIRRVLLVGFMASGKTAVGQILARKLGWRFVDLDALIEERAGRTISHIFRHEGEAAFRSLESETGTEALALEHVVLAAGGGWAAAPGRLEALDRDTLSVWLRVSADTAVQRAAAAGATRPLLDVPDPVHAARTLLARREPYYRRAHLAFDSESLSADEIARRILVEMERRNGAWSSAR